MEAKKESKDLLKLFDAHWFEQEIFPKKQTSTDYTPTPVHQNYENIEKSDLAVNPTLRIRSQSERCLSCKTTFSPRLKTVVSGKELEGLCISPKKGKERKRREKGSGGSRSLSALEFEELKGFMDLGFVFSEQDKESGLVSLIPGLQRLGRKSRKNENEHEEYSVSRPYLSEVWGVIDRRKVNKPLMDQRKFPSMPNDIDMKVCLRAWAQNVASSVK